MASNRSGERSGRSGITVTRLMRRWTKLLRHWLPASPVSAPLTVDDLPVRPPWLLMARRWVLSVRPGAWLDPARTSPSPLRPSRAATAPLFSSARVPSADARLGVLEQQRRASQARRPMLELQRRRPRSTGSVNGNRVVNEETPPASTRAAHAPIFRAWRPPPARLALTPPRIPPSLTETSVTGPEVSAPVPASSLPVGFGGSVSTA